MRIDSSLLKTVLPLITSQMLEDITVEMSPKGWEMFAMSPDRVSMVLVSLPRTVFGDYPVTEDAEDSQFIAFDAQKLLSAVKNFSGEITLNAERGRMFLTDGRFSTRFTTPDPRDIQRRIPSPPVDTVAISTTEDMRRVISASDYDAHTPIKISVLETGLRFSVYDDRGNGSDIVLTPDVYEHPEELYSSSYPLNAVDRFTKALPKGVLVEMRLALNMPLIMTVEDTAYTIRWMVAPRIEDDEE